MLSPSEVACAAAATAHDALITDAFSCPFLTFSGRHAHAAFHMKAAPSCSFHKRKNCHWTCAACCWANVLAVFAANDASFQLCAKSAVHFHFSVICLAAVVIAIVLLVAG